MATGSVWIRRYFNSLDRPRTRKRKSPDVDKLHRRLDEVEGLLPSADPLRRVHLHQEQINLLRRLEEVETPVNPEEVEMKFIEYVAPWAEEKGVSWAALRAAGVPARILRQAGMKP